MPFGRPAGPGGGRRTPSAAAGAYGHRRTGRGPVVHRDGRREGRPDRHAGPGDGASAARRHRPARGRRRRTGTGPPSPGANAVDRIDPTGHVTRFPAPDPDSDPGGITRRPDGGIWYADRSDRTGSVDAQGKVTTFPAPDGAAKVPIRPAAGPDGAVWFTTLIGNTVGRVQGPLRRDQPGGNPLL
ncbi:virginiamycin B lyase family protein [Streptomyces sp. MMG1121]|uniref:virginiamycin B lyase family protein n=1 Tax=Streptomyces sp. MMG1121 TaxID=1415544 RepID=UPI003B63D159